MFKELVEEFIYYCIFLLCLVAHVVLFLAFIEHIFFRFIHKLLNNWLLIVTKATAMKAKMDRKKEQLYFEGM